MKHYMRRRILMILLSAGIVSCASTPPASDIPEGDYLSRAQTQEKGGVRITVAVPSATETEAIFEKNLYRRGIQPVWLDIENSRSEGITFSARGSGSGVLHTD